MHVRVCCRSRWAAGFYMPAAMRSVGSVMAGGAGACPTRRAGRMSHLRTVIAWAGASAVVAYFRTEFC